MEDKYKTAQWRKLRKQTLDDHPLCLNCQCWGRETKATQVHHAIKFAEQWTADAQDAAFTMQENLVPVCSRCHKAIHGDPIYLNAAFADYLYKLKNYVCFKLTEQGFQARWTEDYNKRG